MDHSKLDMDLLTFRVNELRAMLQKMIPENVARKTGSEYLQEEGEIRIPLWDIVLHVSLSGYVVRNSVGDELPSFLQTLVLYYLSTADGTLPSGNLVSFAELPNGRIYDRAFQGYTGDELVKKFGMDVDAYSLTCIRAGGARVDHGGDAHSFKFWVFPRVPIITKYWAGDDDFPSSCKLLFDDSVSHYLPTDACGIIGRQLTKKILRMYSR